MSAMTTKVAGGILTITVNLRDAQKQARPSSTGKSHIWATASEKVDGYDGVRFGFNLYQKAEAGA